MAHGDTREGKWRGNWQMEWVASTLHNTSEHGVSSITTADAHTSAASSRLNWRPRPFKSTLPDFKLSPCSVCCIFSSEWFTSVWILYAEWNRKSVPKRRHIKFRRPGNYPEENIQLKWTRQFRRKTKSGFCACAITFQTRSTKLDFSTQLF